MTTSSGRAGVFSSPGTTAFRTRRSVAFVAVAVAVASGMLLPGLLLGPAQDASIFATVGEQITRWKLPYRDVWDHKPPATYVLAALAAILPGPTWPALWGFAVAFLAATGYLLRRLVGPGVALVAVVAMGLYSGAQGGGQTEAFACLPAAAAVVSASNHKWVWAGLLTGCAMLFSFQVAAMLPALLYVAGRPSGSWVRFIAGGLAVLAATILAFGALGLLPAAVDVLVRYNSVYLGSDRTADLSVGWELVIVPLPFVFAVTMRGRGSLDRLDVAAIIWIALGVGLLTIQGRLIAHYLIPFAIPLAILARGAFDRRGARFVVAVGIAIAIAASLFDLAWWIPIHRGPPSAEIGRWIAAHTAPDSQVLDWGVDAGIYVDANREPAGRYPYLLPLTTHGYATPQMVADWVAQLRARPPSVIVDSEAADPSWPDGADFFRAPPPRGAGGRDLDIVEPFRQFVHERYREAVVIDDRRVYVLK